MNRNKKPSLLFSQSIIPCLTAIHFHLFIISSSNQLMMGNKPGALRKFPSSISHAECDVHSLSAHKYLEASTQQLNPLAFTTIIIVIASINSQHGGERKESEDPQHKARDLTGEERHAGSGRATFKKRRGEGSYCHTCTTQAKTQLRA